jgi:hypothetical protein
LFYSASDLDFFLLVFLFVLLKRSKKGLGSSMIQMYRTALAETCDKLVDSYTQLIRRSVVGPSLDAGADENLGIQVAVDQLESSAQALLRVTQELKVRAILREEKQINAEIGESKIVLKQAEEKLNGTIDRIRRECKVAMQEIMDEISAE